MESIEELCEVDDTGLFSESEDAGVDNVCSGFDCGLGCGDDVFKIGSNSVFGCVSDDKVLFLCSCVLDSFCDVFDSMGEWLSVDFLESSVGDAVENA